MAPIRILLADDHTVMRRGLRLLLEQQADFQVVGEAEDGRQAVDLAASLHPGVAVLDIGMPLLNGIEATRQIITADPAVVVVVLSMHSDENIRLACTEGRGKRLPTEELGRSRLDPGRSCGRRREVVFQSRHKPDVA